MGDSVKDKFKNFFKKKSNKAALNSNAFEADEEQEDWHAKMNTQSKLHNEKRVGYVKNIALVLALMAIVELSLANAKLANSQRIVTPAQVLMVCTEDNLNVRLSTLEFNQDALMQMTDRYIQEYLADRYTIILNKELMEKQWQRGTSKIFWRSSDRVFDEFQLEANRNWENLFARQWKGSVRLEGNPEFLGNGFYRQPVTFIFEHKGVPVFKKEGAVQLQVQYVEREIPRKFINTNEINFQVIFYDLSINKEGPINDAV